MSCRYPRCPAPKGGSCIPLQKRPDRSSGKGFVPAEGRCMQLAHKSQERLCREGPLTTRRMGRLDVVFERSAECQLSGSRPVSALHPEPTSEAGTACQT